MKGREKRYIVLGGGNGDFFNGIFWAAKSNLLYSTCIETTRDEVLRIGLYNPSSDSAEYNLNQGIIASI